MVKHVFYACFIFAICILFSPNPSQAQQLPLTDVDYPAYRVDQVIQACNRNLKNFDYVVLAISAGGTASCIRGDRGFEKETRQQAVDDCNRNRLADEAKLTKCRVVMENGKIFDSKYYKTLRRDARTPMDIEIYDGKTGKLSKTTGFLSSGRLLSRTSVEVKLTSSGGAVLCKGVMKVSGFSARFEATCFDKFVFSGPVPKPEGLAMHEGQVVQRLTMKVKHEKSYISIKPRI